MFHEMRIHGVNRETQFNVWLLERINFDSDLIGLLRCVILIVWIVCNWSRLHLPVREREREELIKIEFYISNINRVVKIDKFKMEFFIASFNK